MGGTFDPIHHGHLVAASEARSRLGLDEVVFVPTGEPWQKDARAVSPAEHRYLMTVIATASNPAFTVSRVDIDRPGPTYTIDTLRDLRRQRPDAELFFITGADVLAQILSWKDAGEMWDLAHFVGVTRPGHALSDAGLPAEGVTLTEVPAMAISSTDCRARVAADEPVWYLVPDGVVQYIGKYHLYRDGVDASADGALGQPTLGTRERPPVVTTPPASRGVEGRPGSGGPVRATDADGAGHAAGARRGDDPSGASNLGAPDDPENLESPETTERLTRAEKETA